MDLYHISFDSGLPATLRPRQPAAQPHVYVKNKKKMNKYPEEYGDRVSFGPTIQGCFSAIYANINRYFEEWDYPHMDMYVYVAINPDMTQCYTPDMLTAQKLVWDAHYTKEHAFTCAVDIKLLAKIRIFNSVKNKEINIHCFNDTTKELRFLSNEIEWKMLKKYLILVPDPI